MWSKIEKVFLYNQIRGLKALDPDESDYYDRALETICVGSNKDIDNLFNYIEGTPDDTASEVSDILSMFICLKESYDALSDKRDLQESSVKWKGFDGNEEQDHYVYANYLIKYTYPDFFKGYETNSHYNRLNDYRRKLEKYNEIKNKKDSSTFDSYLLTYDEIKCIIS